VQEAYGDLICAVATHHPELVPASRYISAASTLVDELSRHPRGSRDRGANAAMHQMLRVLGGACHLTAADANAVLNFALWDLGECGHSAWALSTASIPLVAERRSQQLVGQPAAPPGRLG
jgi:hypothetical protein